MQADTASLTGALQFATVDPNIAAPSASGTAWWACFTGLCAVLLAPLFIVDLPPLLDYPNHLARMFVLAFGAHDTVLSQIYAQHWTIIPNLAIDLVIPPIMKLLPVYVAGRIALGLALLLPLVGVVVFHRVAFGVRSFWPLAEGLMAYNALFILGFMNFEIGLGLALLAGAGWLRWREQYPFSVAILGAAATTAIFFTHVFGLVFLVVLLGGRELAEGCAARANPGALVRRLLQSALIAGFALLPPLALSLKAPALTSPGETTWRQLLEKAVGLLEPFMAYDGMIDRLFGLAFLTVLYIGARAGKVGATHGFGFAAITLLTLYIACPYIAGGTGFIDARFPIMLGLLVFAGLRPVGLSGASRCGVAAVMIAALLARTASLAEVWYEHGNEVAELRQVIAPVPPGSRVIVVSADGATNTVPAARGRAIPGFCRVDFHLPALLVIERRAFWPLLFTAAPKQPLYVLPPYDRIAMDEGVPPNEEALLTRPTRYDLAYAPYLEEWRRSFDFVLVLNPRGADDLARKLPDQLTLLAAEDVAALYRIMPVVE